MEHAVKREDILSALENALSTVDFSLENWSVKSASNVPVGFMARHLILEATVRIDGRLEEIRFFAKAPPTSGSHLTYLEEMQHFQKEIAMYENLTPVMSQVLPKGYKLPVPRCFLTRGTHKKGGAEEAELIIMEDLVSRGYRLSDRMKPFDLNHCRLFMRSLAIFHAPSFLIQKSASQNGKGDNFNYIDGLFRIATDRLLSGSGGELGRLWADTSVETMATAVASFWPERFSGVSMETKLKESLRSGWMELSELSKPSRNHTNVLCHGDLWANNIMFKYKDVEGDVPVDALLVDLQLVRFGPPVTDILLFFYTSTTREFREKNMNDLISVYHQQLQELVGKETLDELMTWSSLLKSIDEYQWFGKFVGSIWLSFILNSEEAVPFVNDSGEPPDFVSKILKDRGDEVLLNARVSDVYKTRIQEAYVECLEYLGIWK